MFGVKNGFDIIIANPPYLNLTFNSFDKKLLKKFYEEFSVFKGAQSKNLFALFIERSCRLRSQEGIISMIVPEGLATTNSYANVRKLLVTNLFMNPQ
jgi:type I restriction-modification system DNA methylase subunit